MLSILIILAIALAIFLGYKTRINTGLFCIAFAYVIGCLMMGIKPKAVIGFWPVSSMFVILSVSLFYNVAAINGTLEKMPGAVAINAGALAGGKRRHFSSAFGTF